MATSTGQAGKWLAVIVAGTLIIDWSVRVLVSAAIKVLPVVILVSGLAALVWLVWHLISRDRHW